MSDNNTRIIQIKTSARDQFVDITEQVSALLRKESVDNGICYVFVPHTTAAVTINENADPDVRKDMLLGLEDIVSETLGYRHAEGNSTAHIKSSLIGNSINVIIEGGALLLGTWQGIYFCEFDGPRSRKVYVKIVASR